MTNPGYTDKDNTDSIRWTQTGKTVPIDDVYMINDNTCGDTLVESHR